MKFKILFCFVLLLLLLSGCPDDNDPYFDIAESISEQLNSEGIDVTLVEVTEDEIRVTYSQPVSASEKEVYGTWAYVFGTSLNKASAVPEIYRNIETLSIQCDFDDGEEMLISTTPKEILDFLAEDTDAWDFLYALDIEPLTQGPQVPTE